MIYLTIWLIGILVTVGYCYKNATEGAGYFRAVFEILVLIIFWSVILGMALGRDIEEIKKAVTK